MSFSYSPDFLSSPASSTDLLSSPCVPLEKLKFIRRPELTGEIRTNIGSTALYAISNREWGAITRMAEQYHVSRTFIYSLGNRVKAICQLLFGGCGSTDHPSPSHEKEIGTMLSLRMEGGSSIGGISTIMKRQGLRLSSTGSISQTLSRVGRSLPTTMTIGAESLVIPYIVYASDEIYSRSKPILVSVEPGSTAILRVELSGSCTGRDWQNHFVCLEINGIKVGLRVSDGGTGLCAGHVAMGDVVRQTDTYHAVAHTIGSWVYRLEMAAYAAISREYERLRTLWSAKSSRVREKREAEYARAVEHAVKAITISENFTYLYRCIVGELNVFDCDGNLRDKQQAEENIRCGLALIEELNIPKLTDAVNKVRRALPDLFHYFDSAKRIAGECVALVPDDDVLKAYFVAWQWGKSARKAKDSARKKAALEEEKFCIEMAEGLNQRDDEKGEDENRDEEIRREVYSRLDRIVQSSAIVECINSIIRPYLNTSKNRVTQELLNLIMHYHNHRRYLDGVRKKSTPMELLTGKEQSIDWIEILFDIIREKDPALLLAS